MDNQTSHNNDEIGYVMTERGHVSASAIEFEAGVTPYEIVEGWVIVTGGYQVPTSV
jgi:hypothetical protein